MGQQVLEWLHSFQTLDLELDYHQPVIDIKDVKLEDMFARKCVSRLVEK